MKYPIALSKKMPTWLLVAGLLALQACGDGSNEAAAPTAPPAGTTPTTPVVPTQPVAPSPPVLPTPPVVPTPPVAPAPVPPVAGAEFTPLSWTDRQPVTQYRRADGTLVTQIGGRVRDRHAREQQEPGGSGDLYGLFAPHYFERRTQDMTIYENVSPKDPAHRILTIVVRPQWWWYGTNFRHGFIGRRDGDPMGPAAVALYGDNGGMKRLAAGRLHAGQELQTPVADYDSLPEDPNANYATDLAKAPADGEFVLVKQITWAAPQRRDLRDGDVVEFELGIFLAGQQGDALGRFNYYADAVVYQVGKAGAQAWYRGPCCDGVAIPWEPRLLPAAALAGGGMTLPEDTSAQPDHLLLQAGTNIAGSNIQPFMEGRRLFHTSFLTGVHVEAGNGTLFDSVAGRAGPKFQQAACIACHTANGKSSPVQGNALNAMVVLTSDIDAAGKPIPDPRFGTRLSQGVVTEGGQRFDGRQAILKVASMRQSSGRYGDGGTYSLEQPVYALTDVAGQAIALPKRMSVRTAPHLVGMGLLEAVPEATLQALAAASVRDADGVAGRLQIVRDARDPGLKRVGRFGWRATAATVEQQTAVAFNADMGVTSSLLPKHLCGEAGAAGAECRAADGRGAEISDRDLALVVKYMSLLGVPSQRHFAGQQPVGPAAPVILVQGAVQTAAQEAAETALQARVKRGGELFGQARCTACHVASMTTGDHRFAELRQQTIRPYTDLLLHDMGVELADQHPQGVASEREWRTAPLWGIGVLKAIDPNTRFLHDGRARTLEEAVLWHGGQGAASRDRFKAFGADDRRRVIEFLESL